VTVLLRSTSCWSAASPPGLVSSCTSSAVFFSSRRRHTRCYRDWSSDVCSSDLEEYLYRYRRVGHDLRILPAKYVPLDIELTVCRSEERRVGKECRFRGSPEHEKKNDHH